MFPDRAAAGSGTGGLKQDVPSPSTRGVSQVMEAKAVGTGVDIDLTGASPVGSTQGTPKGVRSDTNSHGGTNAGAGAGAGALGRKTAVVCGSKVAPSLQEGMTCVGAASGWSSRQDEKLINPSAPRMALESSDEVMSHATRARSTTTTVSSQDQGVTAALKHSKRARELEDEVFGPSSDLADKTVRDRQSMRSPKKKMKTDRPPDLPSTGRASDSAGRRRAAAVESDSESSDSDSDGDDMTIGRAVEVQRAITAASSRSNADLDSDKKGLARGVSSSKSSSKASLAQAAPHRRRKVTPAVGAGLAPAGGPPPPNVALVSETKATGRYVAVGGNMAGMGTKLGPIRVRKGSRRAREAMDAALETA